MASPVLVMLGIRLEFYYPWFRKKQGIKSMHFYVKWLKWVNATLLDGAAKT